MSVLIDAHLMVSIVRQKVSHLKWGRKLLSENNENLLFVNIFANAWEKLNKNLIFLPELDQL